MSDDPYKAYREYYEAISKEMLGYLVSTSTYPWSPIPDPATQPLVYHGYAGGGGGKGGDGQMRITATGTKGGAGGQTFPCRCGLQATRFTGALGECAKCHQDRRIADQLAATVGQSQTVFAAAVERIAEAGRVAKPEPPPEPTHCACGASFATVRKFSTGTLPPTCGDCFGDLRKLPWGEDQAAPIDVRIRDAREGRDEDPTTWTAGATPGWEWP